tara:strand:- start:3444 stop:3632 length:189 start_codon:yes stop_codon:yes gene_type:complete
MDGGTLFLFSLVCFLFCMRQIMRAAEKSRVNSQREQVVREMVRKHQQKMKLDRLYGREEEDK